MTSKKFDDKAHQILEFWFCWFFVVFIVLSAILIFANNFNKDNELKFYNIQLI